MPRCQVFRWRLALVALAVIPLLAGRTGAEQGVEQEPQCLVAIGDPLANAEHGVTDEVTTFGVLVSDSNVVVPLLAVTESSLRINSGKDQVPNPDAGGDQMLGAPGELAALPQVPMHVWNPEAKKVQTMEARLLAVDGSRSLALYKLPQELPGRSANLYEGEVPDGLKVTYGPYVSFFLRTGPAVRPIPQAVLSTRFGLKDEAEGDWGIMFQAGWPHRGAGVYVEGKLVGIVSEYTHYRIEPSPSHPEKRGPAVYVILVSRIRQFLTEQGRR